MRRKNKRPNCFSILIFLLFIVFGINSWSKTEIEEKIIIQSSAESVWNRIKSFNDLSWLPPAKKVVSASTENKTGDLRIITTEANWLIQEELTQYKPKQKTYSYAINSILIGHRLCPFFSPVLALQLFKMAKRTIGLIHAYKTLFSI